MFNVKIKMFSAIVLIPMLEEQLRMNFCVCMIIQILRNYECNQWQSWIPWWFSWTNFSLGYSCCFVLFLLNCVLVCEHLFFVAKCLSTIASGLGIRNWNPKASSYSLLLLNFFRNWKSPRTFCMTLQIITCLT